MAKSKSNSKIAAKNALTADTVNYLDEQGLGDPDLAGIKVPEDVVPTGRNPLADYVNSQHFGQSTETPVQNAEFTPEESDAIKSEISNEEKYGDNIGATAAAAGAGLLRGALPAADLILTKGFKVNPETLKQLKERHDVISPVSEVAGLVGGAVASGGENLLAKASVGGAVALGEKQIANAIAKGVFKNAAEKGIARSIVEQGIARGAGGALTGGAMGINQLINEDAIGEAELNAENLLAYGGTGAILNGLVGGAFGALEASAPLVKTGFDKATGQAKRVFNKVVDFDQNLAELVAEQPARRAQVLTSLEQIPQEAKPAYISERWKLGQFDSTDEMVAKHVKAGEAIGKDLETAYKMVDRNVPTGVVPIAETDGLLTKAFQKFKQENIDYFDSSAGKALERQFGRELSAKAARMGETETAENFWKTLQNWGDQAKTYYRNPAESPVKAELYAHMRDAAKDILQSNIERVTTGTAVEGILKDIKKINTEYRLWSTLDRGLSKKGVSQKGLLDLKETMWALGAGGMGHPGLGAVMVAGKKALQSDMRRKFVVLNAVQAANQQFAKKAADATASFFKGTGKVAGAIAAGTVKSDLARSGFALSADRKQPKSTKEAFQNIKRNILDLNANPEKLAVKVAGSLMKASQYAPATANAAQVTMHKAVQFLQSKLPSSVNEQSDFINKREWQPSDVDVAKFSRYVKIIDNPYTVLDELHNGTLTREHVEALKTVYPKIYGRVQDHIMDQVSTNEAHVPYGKKVQLGLLLGLPTDSSMKPMNVAALQSNFQQQPQGQQGAIKTTQGGTENIKKSERLKTGMQEASEGIES